MSRTKTQAHPCAQLLPLALLGAVPTQFTVGEVANSSMQSCRHRLTLLYLDLTLVLKKIRKMLCFTIGQCIEYMEVNVQLLQLAGRSLKVGAIMDSPAAHATTLTISVDANARRQGGARVRRNRIEPMFLMTGLVSDVSHCSIVTVSFTQPHAWLRGGLHTIWRTISCAHILCPTFASCMLGFG